MNANKGKTWGLEKTEKHGAQAKIIPTGLYEAKTPGR